MLPSCDVWQFWLAKSIAISFCELHTGTASATLRCIYTVGQKIFFFVRDIFIPQGKGINLPERYQVCLQKAFSAAALTTGSTLAKLLMLLSSSRSWCGADAARGQLDHHELKTNVQKSTNLEIFCNWDLEAISWGYILAALPFCNNRAVSPSIGLCEQHNIPRTGIVLH